MANGGSRTAKNFVLEVYGLSYHLPNPKKYKLRFLFLFMNKIFIIEHLEPKLWKWCLIEYKHISEIVGRENLVFTNIKKEKDVEVLEQIGKVIKNSVSELKLKNVCVLDPESDKTLDSKNSKSFEYFVFGGILGDYPPKKRTKKELTQFVKDASVFNIGKKQMPTDNAVYVVNEIIKGKNISDLKFKYKIEIPIKEGESVDMPYNYILVDEKPLISKELLEHIKKGKSF
jgi:ribosome biogenesis SPOUT family RNA methylase Rps3